MDQLIVEYSVSETFKFLFCIVVNIEFFPVPRKLYLGPDIKKDNLECTCMVTKKPNQFQLSEIEH